MSCRAGLSTLELQHSFPEASITALDLSPHFLAVARHLQQQREDGTPSRPEQIRRASCKWQHCVACAFGPVPLAASRHPYLLTKSSFASAVVVKVCVLGFAKPSTLAWTMDLAGSSMQRPRKQGLQIVQQTLCLYAW